MLCDCGLGVIQQYNIYSKTATFFEKSGKNTQLGLAVALATWYNYKKDGSVNEAPSYDRIVQNTLVYARVKWSDLSLVKEIEAHSPIKVTVNNT